MVAGVRGAERVEGDVGAAYLFACHAEHPFDGRGREQPFFHHARVEQHGVGLAVLAEPADVVLDERHERPGDGHDPFAAFGLGLAQSVFAFVVRSPVDGVADVELQVLQVDVAQLQGAYLAEAQAADQEREPEREPVVVGEEVGHPFDLVRGDGWLVASFGLRFGDAVSARACRDEWRRPVVLFSCRGEHDPLEGARRVLERAGCQLVLGLRVPFVDHLAADAVERDVAEGLVEAPQRDFVAPVGTSGQSAAVVFAVVVEVVPGVLRECGHVLRASLRWVDPLTDPLVVEGDEVVLLVEPSECLRLVFQAEVPADLFPRVERVDVSRLE